MEAVKFLEVINLNPANMSNLHLSQLDPPNLFSQAHLLWLMHLPFPEQTALSFENELPHFVTSQSDP